MHINMSISVSPAPSSSSLSPPRGTPDRGSSLALVHGLVVSVGHGQPRRADAVHALRVVDGPVEESLKVGALELANVALLRLRLEGRVGLLERPRTLTAPAHGQPLEIDGRREAKVRLALRAALRDHREAGHALLDLLLAKIDAEALA